VTAAQLALAHALRVAGYDVQTEVRFAAPRRWRIDVTAARPQGTRKLAIEIDGGVWVQGRHTRGAGVEKDNEKIAHLAIQGWLFLRVTPRQVTTGQAARWAGDILNADADTTTTTH